MLKGKTIGILGAGNMGEALIGGLVKACIVSPDQIVASRRNKSALRKLEELYGIRTTVDNRELVKESDVVVVAVKPQVLPDVLDGVSDLFHNGKLLISIAAGISTDLIEQLLGKDVPVIRVMPNVAALGGEGISPYCLGKHSTEAHALMANEIFSAVGVTVMVDEELMDPVTAISGTGPAYVFYLMEALIDAGTALGFPPIVARALVRQTFYGAAKLLTETTKTPTDLRLMVTSPQGTTHAAISYLESREFSSLIKAAVDRANIRAKELGAMHAKRLASRNKTRKD